MDLSALAAAESLEVLVLLDDHGRHTLDLTPLTGLTRLRSVITDGWADVRGARQLKRKGVYVEGLSKS
ncbi:hypothetical protein N8J89_28085 [Crossiella sp. CA-258035]|uniref:hypothetical protein n=1 Tax=Crossiella sp. CA-258035 TaxID=2981138 RepID=UPI0024BC588A|nr:hypothetical protein [Crossiella sp. CA-258035]WHT16977.1 hypothetical protein N8J89_28085 [Crossiella sp. CA-258035]